MSEKKKNRAKPTKENKINVEKQEKKHEILKEEKEVQYVASEKMSRHETKIEKDKFENVVKYMREKEILNYVLIGFAVFALALIFTAQIKTVSTSKEVIQGKREAELVDDLNSLKREYEQLKEENEKYKGVVEEYKSNTSTNSSLINSMTEELNTATALAGLKKVKGEGIIITLDDSDMAVSETISTESMLVHDTDLRAIVNEINAAGAEAVSINGQRIISNTAIRCVGPVIQVNGVKVAAPFYIKAIGNAKYLESALNIKGGIIDSLELYGIKVNISRESSIQIDKYDGKVFFKNATVVEE